MTRPLRVLLLALALLAGAGPAMAQATCDRSPILVRNVRLWTPSGSARKDVLFSDGLVASVRPAGSIRQSRGMRVLDGAGQTLLPGLVDLHLHIGVPGGLPESAESPLVTTSQIAGRQLLRSGVTSGRIHFMTLAGGAQLKKLAADPCSALPRLQMGGPAVAGGLSDTNNPSFAGVRSADDAIARVRAAADAQVEWLAIYDAHKFRPGEYDALSNAADRFGVRLTGSGNTFQEIDAALSAGIKTVDYIDTSAAEAYPDATLRKLPGAALIPTIGIHYRHHSYAADPKLLEQRSNFEFMTAAEQQFVLDKARAALQSEFAAISRRAFPHLRTKFRQLLATGVPMATGTDVGSEAHFHSGAIWWELEAWRAFGAQPRQALTAATATAAQILRDERVGTLKPGAYADFVLYAGDPEKGRLDLARVRSVGKAGILFVQDGRWVGPIR